MCSPCQLKIKRIIVDSSPYYTQEDFLGEWGFSTNEKVSLLEEEVDDFVARHDFLKVS